VRCKLTSVRPSVRLLRKPKDKWSCAVKWHELSNCLNKVYHFAPICYNQGTMNKRDPHWPQSWVLIHVLTDTKFFLYFEAVTFKLFSQNLTNHLIKYNLRKYFYVNPWRQTSIPVLFRFFLSAVDFPVLSRNDHDVSCADACNEPFRKVFQNQTIRQSKVECTNRIYVNIYNNKL
jgi:hypothetical protein